jgi:hypothetical protein
MVERGQHAARPCNHWIKVQDELLTSMCLYWLRITGFAPAGYPPMRPTWQRFCITLAGAKIIQGARRPCAGERP